MSETELFKGKLKEFAREPDETFQNYVERFIKEKKQKIPSSYQRKLSEKDVEEMFRDVFYKEHGVLIDKIIYEIVQIQTYDDSDIFEASRQQEKTQDLSGDVVGILDMAGDLAVEHVLSNETVKKLMNLLDEQQ